ncbi:MAG: glycosyltransferase family 4 protein [Vicinamibacterales bacterium]
MRICFVSYDFPEYCIRHVNELTEAGEVLLLLPEKITTDYVPLLNPRVRFEPFYKPRLRQPASQVRTALGVVRAIQRFRPDVVHFQNGHMYFNLAMPLLSRFPLVITIHDPRQHLGDSESGHTPQWIMDFGFRRADHVIVHGRSLIETVVNELGFARSDVHLIPLVALGEPGDRPELIADDDRTILFFGRIWEYKGLEFLIRAEPQVTSEFPDVTFVIAGRGEDLQRYRRLMTHPERFEVNEGWITDQDRATLFSRASAVVLPYVEATQSAVVPIAYAHAKPVVATRVGGLPDMVEHGVTGLLVEPRDVDGLADAIKQLLRDRDARIRMGQAGKEKLVRECSPAVVARQTLAVYQAAIASRSGPRRRME